MAGFNYSKWDKLELSDDEDTHPGAQFIEKNTLRRIKRESHEVKEQERQEKIASLRSEQAADDKAFRELELKAAALTAEGDAAAADAARSELWGKQQAIDKRGAEVAKLERERKFNADEMCYVAKEKTLVGSAACKPDALKEVSYEDYVALHKKTMDKYASRVRDAEENQTFLEEHPELLHEHCMGYLLMEALQLGMDEKKAAMKRVVKQKYHIKSLLDFAEARKSNIREVVRPFFSRLANDAPVAKEYESSCDALYDKLLERAVEKRREREAALAAEEEEATPLSREERLGPGGLDPIDVFESLPEPLQKAYEEKDTEALRAFVNSVPVKEAKEIMRKMVGSGLWVPEPGGEGSLLREGAEDEEDEEGGEGEEAAAP